MADWVETLADYGLRLGRGLRRSVIERDNRLKAARLPRLETVLAPAQQRLDLAAARLPSAQRLYEPQRNALALQRLPDPMRLIADRGRAVAALRLPPMTRLLSRAAERLDQRDKALKAAMRFAKTRHVTRLQQRVEAASRLDDAARRALTQQMETQSQRLSRAGKLLDAYSYQGVLERGYALVQDEAGKVVKSQKAVKSGQAVTLTFADGEAGAVIAGGPKTSAAVKEKSKAKKDGTPQGDLF
jgi:exodeoxyribonuclease VII large subunit